MTQAEFPTEGVVLTHLLVVSDLERAVTSRTKCRWTFSKGIEEVSSLHAKHSSVRSIT